MDCPDYSDLARLERRIEDLECEVKLVQNEVAELEKDRTQLRLALQHVLSAFAEQHSFNGFRVSAVQHQLDVAALEVGACRE